MGADRRKHLRSLKELEFTCYIDGQKFEARSLDVSRGGALMKTGELLPMGSVALIAMKKGTASEDELERRPSRRQGHWSNPPYSLTLQNESRGINQVT